MHICMNINARGKGRRRRGKKREKGKKIFVGIIKQKKRKENDEGRRMTKEGKERKNANEY